MTAYALFMWFVLIVAALGFAWMVADLALNIRDEWRES